LPGPVGPGAHFERCSLGKGRRASKSSSCRFRPFGPAEPRGGPLRATCKRAFGNLNPRARTFLSAASRAQARFAPPRPLGPLARLWLSRRGPRKKRNSPTRSAFQGARKKNHSFEAPFLTGPERPTTAKDVGHCGHGRRDQRPRARGSGEYGRAEDTTHRQESKRRSEGGSLTLARAPSRRSGHARLSLVLQTLSQYPKLVLRGGSPQTPGSALVGVRGENSPWPFLGAVFEPAAGWAAAEVIVWALAFSRSGTTNNQAAGRGGPGKETVARRERKLVSRGRPGLLSVNESARLAAGSRPASRAEVAPPPRLKSLRLVRLPRPPARRQRNAAPPLPSACFFCRRERT